MRIRLIDDNLKKIWSSRYRGLWFALALSVVGHGILLYGLSKGFSRRGLSEIRVANEVLLIRLLAQPMLASSVAVVEIPEQAILDSPQTQAKQTGLLGQQEIDEAKGFSSDAPSEVPMKRDQRHGPPSPDEHQGEIKCFGKNIEDIPDVGQSNRLGRRKEVDPCEQG